MKLKMEYVSNREGRLLYVLISSEDQPPPLAEMLAVKRRLELAGERLPVFVPQLSEQIVFD